MINYSDARVANGRVGIYLWKAVVSVITEDIGRGGGGRD